MLVLALETATRRGSMAYWRDGRTVAAAGHSADTHGQRLPGELLDWLSGQGIALADVDLFAIASGPGSFTGLRVGMAAVQGLALPTGRRVIPVPTLEALAEAAIGPTLVDGLLAPFLDGQRGDVFVAAWEVAAGTSTIDEATPVLEPMAGPPAEVAQALVDLAAGRPVFLAGDTATRSAAALARALPAATMVEPAVTLAEATARLAARRTDHAVAPHGLRPLYVRRPDALMARDRARVAAPAAPAADLVIRRATPNDFDRVAALQAATFTNAWGVDAIRWEIDHTDVARLYVADDGQGVLVAYCACWVVFDELHINSLAVDVTVRRRGLAGRLLRHVFAEAVAAGASSATLEVRESNAAARALYEGLGFTVEGVRRNYYQTPREDALVLWHRRLREAFGA